MGRRKKSLVQRCIMLNVQLKKISERHTYRMVRGIGDFSLLMEDKGTDKCFEVEDLNT